MSGMPARAILLFALLLSAFAPPENRRAEPDATRNQALPSDYPPGSLRAGEQGMSSVEYEVDVRGRVAPGSCRITATSGFARLDARTCELIERRYRFTPAMEDGIVVAETRQQDIFWRLPDAHNGTPLNRAADRVVVSYGRCLVKEAPEAAARIIALPLNGEQQKAAVIAIKAVAPCGGRGDLLAVTPTIVAGAIAEALLESRFADVLPPLPDGRAPLAARDGTEELALCVARRDPATIRELLATVPSGPEERRVIDKLLPQLAPCVPDGLTINFTRPSMRALFALGLYRDAAHAAETR